MFRIDFRTPEEKADLAASWARSDAEFFGAGACHVLAGTFVQTYPSGGLRPLMIQPANGFRGRHVLVANERLAFDCRGWNARDELLRLYSDVMRAKYPDWSCVLVPIDDPMGWEFCRRYKHRHPTQFPHDPILRAREFLRQFPAPAGI